MLPSSLDRSPIAIAFEKQLASPPFNTTLQGVNNVEIDERDAVDLMAIFTALFKSSQAQTFTSSYEEYYLKRSGSVCHGYELGKCLGNNSRGVYYYEATRFNFAVSPEGELIEKGESPAFCHRFTLRRRPWDSLCSRIQSVSAFKECADIAPVTCWGLDYATDVLFTFMPFYPSDALNLVNKRPISESEFNIVASQIGQALRFMHRLGYVHRDVTLQNILLLMQNDRVVGAHMSDMEFIAQPKINPPDPRLSHCVGSRCYFAPECFAKFTNYHDFFRSVRQKLPEGQEIDPFAQDVYGYGASLYVILEHDFLFFNNLVSRYYDELDKGNHKQAIINQRVVHAFTLNALDQETPDHSKISSLFDLLRQTTLINPTLRTTMEKICIYWQGQLSTP